MTTYNTLFTKWFEDNYSGIDWSSGQAVKVMLFNALPVFDDGAKDRFYLLEDLADSYTDGWVPTTSDIEARMSEGVSPDPAISFFLKELIVSDDEYLQLVNSDDVAIAVENGEGWYLVNPDPEGEVQEVIAGAVWYLDDPVGDVVNPVLFATKYGVGEAIVAHDGAVYGQFETGADISEQYVVAYNPSTKFSIGYVLLRLSIPRWEGAHSHHLWIQPQRVNYIANPSFEHVDSAWWRVGHLSETGTASLDRVVGGVDVERIHCGHVSSPDSVNTLVLESNLFPNTTGWFSVSFYASGTGSLRFGLVVNGVSYSFRTFMCTESFELTGGSATSSFRKFTGLFPSQPDSADYHLRIEFIGEEFWVDNVLVDPNPGQYDYFDGNSTESIAGDFQWMGDSDNSHYSMWYSNYRNSKARLVGAFDTNDGVYKPGLVDDWAPTGASVSVHWDTVGSVTPLNWVGDYIHPIYDMSDTSVSLINSELSYSPEVTISDYFATDEAGIIIYTESGVPLQLQ
jgi:hypothetical protein